MNILQLTGQIRTHITQYDTPRFAVQKIVGDAFFDMRNEARKSGFEIFPVSAFRDFDSQLRIWNLKFAGKRPLFDREGIRRDYHQLNESERIRCILNWSALPGASRHHWGTEIDVADQTAVKGGYRVQLLPEEVNEDGLFYALHCWLDENMKRFGFYRPYLGKGDGMYSEPWHISFGRIADPALNELTLELLDQLIEKSQISGKVRVREILPEIYQKHVINVEPYIP